MSASGSNAPMSPALRTLRQQAVGWWRERTPRERQLVVLVGGVLVLYLVWSLLVSPALGTVRAAPAQLDRLDAQYQQMQRVAAESGALRGAPRIGAIQAGQALKAATDRLGDRAKLVQQGDRATLTLTGIAPEALRAWLGEARSGARARPVEVNLQRGAVGFNGTVIVAIGGNS